MEMNEALIKRIKNEVLMMTEEELLVRKEIRDKLEDGNAVRELEVEVLGDLN